MHLLILIIVGVLIGVKVRRWRSVFMGAGWVGVCLGALATGSLLLQDAEDREYGFVPVLGAAGVGFVVSLIVIAITFAILEGTRRDEAALPPPEEADQFRES